MSGVNVFVVFLIHVLEWAFVIGMVGSAFVILIASIEDIEVVLEREPAAPGQPPPENVSTD